MELIYLDPPYLGCAGYYKEHPNCLDYNKISKHEDMLEEAFSRSKNVVISLSQKNLMKYFLILQQKPVIGAYVKHPTVNHNGYASEWEPVLFYLENPIKNWRNVYIDQAPNHTGTIGAKPIGFYHWIFRSAGLRIEDEFKEFFPGSCNGDRALYFYRKQMELSL